MKETEIDRKRRERGQGKDRMKERRIDKGREREQGRQNEGVRKRQGERKGTRKKTE